MKECGIMKTTPTPEEQNDIIRAQVESEMPTPAGGFETEEQRDNHRKRHDARFIELCTRIETHIA